MKPPTKAQVRYLRYVHEGRFQPPGTPQSRSRLCRIAHDRGWLFFSSTSGRYLLTHAGLEAAGLAHLDNPQLEES